MHCPIDNTTLQMTTRDGIEIDYCPNCRGVWLDRGELDKLIERAGSYYGATPGASASTARPQPQPYPQRTQHFDDDDDDYRHHDRHYDDSSHHGHKKKKEGFLGDLFDF